MTNSSVFRGLPEFFTGVRSMVAAKEVCLVYCSWDDGLLCRSEKRGDKWSTFVCVLLLCTLNVQRLLERKRLTLGPRREKIDPWPPILQWWSFTECSRASVANHDKTKHRWHGLIVTTQDLTD